MKKLALFVLGLALLLAPVSAQALMVGDWGGWATVGTQFNENISGYLGYSYFNPTNWLLVKADYNLAKLGDVQTKVGANFELTSPNSGSSLGLSWGISAMMVKNLMIGTDLILVRFNRNAGGGGTTDIIPAAVMVAQLLL